MARDHMSHMTNTRKAHALAYSLRLGVVCIYGNAPICVSLDSHKSICCALYVTCIALFVFIASCLQLSAIQL